MLMITDFGCDLHRLRRLKFFGPEARLMKDLFGTPRPDGDDHIYVCSHGRTHHLMVEAPIPDALTDGLNGLGSH